MDLDFQDDSFADADLDGLPDNALDELEERAILSTQQPPRAARSNEGVNTKAGVSEPESGDGEDEVINLNARLPLPTRKRLDDATQREQWRQQRYGAGSNRPIPATPAIHGNEAANVRLTQQLLSQQSLNGNTLPRPSQRAQPDKEPPSQISSTYGDDKAKVERLLARVRELEQERISLKSQAEEAKSAVLSRAGEIAIVRANHEKDTKEYERRMAVMQKAHAEETLKQKADLEAARKEREQMETSNKFLEHDLAQEAEKAKHLRKTLKDGSGNAARVTKSALAGPSPLSTPKKTGSLAMRDGFDDDEVVLISPSKANDRLAKGAGTPRAGAKRKRPLVEKLASPGAAATVTATASLEFEQSHSFTVPDTNTPPAAPISTAIDQTRGSDQHEPDEKFEFIKVILNHRCFPQDIRTVESLSTFSFKTSLAESLSSKIYEQLNHVPTHESVEQLRIRFCQTIIDLWARCLQDEFQNPLYQLTELLQYILIISPPETSAPLISSIVKLSAQTADLVALPRAKALKHQSLSSENMSNDANAFISLEKYINPWDYLQLLNLVALNASLHAQSKEIEVFWRAMEYDFVLLMLHRAQPLNQIILMLHLLGTSTLASSFGAMSADTATPQQRKHESDIVDRLTVLLFETSIAPSSDPPSSSSPLTLLHLRYSVLSLLREICSTSHGGALLASHRLVIGRLVRFLHDAVLSMYSAALNPPIAYGVGEADSSGSSAATGVGKITAATLVNETVLILAHLTTVHASKIRDIRTRLGTIPSGPQKYLVALSRVAFAEGLTDVENGIDAEASEAAHAMLDEMLSPEEGEEVIKVFSSGSVSASASVPASVPLASVPVSEYYGHHDERQVLSEEGQEKKHKAKNASVSDNNYGGGFTNTVISSASATFSQRSRAAAAQPLIREKKKDNIKATTNVNASRESPKSSSPTSSDADREL